MTRNSRWVNGEAKKRFSKLSIALLDTGLPPPTSITWRSQWMNDFDENGTSMKMRWWALDDYLAPFGAEWISRMFRVWIRVIYFRALDSQCRDVSVRSTKSRFSLRFNDLIILLSRTVSKCFIWKWHFQDLSTGHPVKCQSILAIMIKTIATQLEASFWRWIQAQHRFGFQEIFEMLRRGLRKNKSFVRVVRSFNWVMRSPMMWGYLEGGVTRTLTHTNTIKCSCELHVLQ